MLQQQPKSEWSDDEDDGFYKYKYSRGSLNEYNKTYNHDGPPNDAFK